MAYEKQTWATGDVITEEKLNHMEDGIASGGVLIVNETMDQSTLIGALDKTWKEIHDTYINGAKVLIRYALGVLSGSETYGSLLQITNAGSSTKPFSVTFTNQEYATAAEDGYPDAVGSGDIH